MAIVSIPDKEITRLCEERAALAALVARYQMALEGIAESSSYEAHPLREIASVALGKADD